MTLNLIEGLSLELMHPEVPSCADCQAWLYDVATWRKSMRGGKPVARPPGSPLPCLKCPKSGRPNEPHPEKELLPQNRQAVAYYYLCHEDTTGLLPRDLVVVHNNALIGRIIRQADRNRPDAALMILAGMLGKGK